MYVGTSNGRLYRSDNSGLTWTFRGTIAGANITRIIVDNLDSDIVYAGTASDGVHRSLDGGVSWSQFPRSNPVTDVLQIKSLALDSSTPRKLYAGTDGNGVYQFAFGDTVLSAINLGLNNGRIFDLAVHPLEPYIIFSTTEENSLNAVYKYIGNRSPIIDPISDKQLNVGELVTFTVTASDPDTGETSDLVFLVDNLPQNATYDSLATHVFSWIPAQSDTGDNVVVFKVHDLRNGQDSSVVTINVNRIPTITIADTTISGVEDSLITFTVSATDLDNDPLLFSASNLPTGATYDTSGAKTFTWTPGFDQAGSTTVTFTVDDSRTGVVTKNVIFSIQNKNRNPFFDPAISDKAVQEGSLLSFTVNGTDLDNDPITYSILDTLPIGAGYDSVDTKRFSWIPTFEDSGRHVVVFTLRDDLGGSATDSVAITVQNVNRVPVFSTIADTFSINEGESISFTVRATDADGDSVSYDAANLPQSSTFNKFSGLFIWIPNFSQSGTHRVVFNALDDQGGGSFRDVFLVVQDVQVPLPGTDFAPTIIGTEDKVINENETVIFQVVATDDGLQDSLTFNLDNALPSGATFDAQGTHIFEWVTTFNDSGTYVLAFSVTDSFPNTARDTVLITVNNINRLPVTTVPTDTNFAEGTSIVLPLGISDPDNDAITITYFEVPFGSLIKSGGVDTLVWTPTFLQEGVY